MNTSSIKNLCNAFIPPNTDKRVLDSILERVISRIRKSELESIPSFSCIKFEEGEVVEKIKKKLSSNINNGRLRFLALYKKLKDSDLTAEERLYVLRFLFEISNLCDDQDQKKLRHSNFSPLSMSSSSSTFSNYSPSVEQYTENISPITLGDKHSILNSYDSPFNEKPVASSSKTSFTKFSSQSDIPRNNCKQTRTVSFESFPHSRPAQLAVESSYNSQNVAVQKSKNYSEIEVIKELLFCFHGVEGKLIKYDEDRIGFRLNPTVNVRCSHLILDLMELGYLHNYIKQGCQKLVNKKGVVAYSLTHAIGNRIIEFYKDVAVVDIKIEKYLNPVPDTPLTEELSYKDNKIPTLIQLKTWSFKHKDNFKCLASIIKLLEDKHGGQIISTLYHYVHNGDPELHLLLMKLLAAATAPIYKIMSHWIIKGEFSDIYNEFFIRHVPHLDINDIWDQQFVLRKDNIPIFMKLEDAERILQAGRCIHFLHKICNERPPLTPAQKKLKERVDDGTGNLLQLLEPENKLSALIHQALTESSKLVLHSLKENFNFTYHFEALRKFMLLGQGNFIYCLMQALENDLNKIAGTIDHCRLIGLLESALSMTGVGTDQGVLSRLNIKLLDACDTESGWDAFCLTYNVDGPLNAIFKIDSGEYSRIFTFLWRIKRAEYFLCRMWSDTILLLKKVLCIIPEIATIFGVACKLINQMLQFVNHFQYYIAFEVVEVSWCKFQDEVNKMESLDRIVNAHNCFMLSIQQGCMLTDVDMLKNIRNLLDYVLELIPTIEILHNNCEKELHRRIEYNANVEKFGTDATNEATNASRVHEFCSSMKNSKSRLVVVSKQYQESLCTFLVHLSNHKDPTLQILGHQMDFNEYYKNRNAFLSESFKFSKQSEYLNFSSSFNNTSIFNS